jgi:hypothetical protein
VERATPKRAAISARDTLIRKAENRASVGSPVPVIEQDGDGIFRRTGYIALIRDDDEVRVAVAVEVVYGNLPMINVGDDDPSGAGPSGDRDLTKVLTMRREADGDEHQREVVQIAQGGTLKVQRRMSKA